MSRLPGTVANCSAPYTIDHEAVQARQRAIMDLESATLAIVAKAIHHQQHPTSLAATRIKWNPLQLLRPGPLTISAPPALQTVAGPSFTRQHRPNSRERNTFRKICSGEGVSSFGIQGLLEQCGVCKLYFTGSILCSHIFECSRP